MKLSYLKTKRKSHTHGLTRWQYSSYLKSKHWKNFRKRMVKVKGYKCWLCGSTHMLQLHHKTYIGLGAEKPNHVIWLCQKDHSLVHKTLWENKDDKSITLWNVAGKIKKQKKRNNE